MQQPNMALPWMSAPHESSHMPELDDSILFW